MPPPSSGGVCLAQIMKVVEQFPLSEYGFHSSTSIQLVTEAERRAYANRAYYLGDPDFVDIPIQSLLSDSLIRAMANEIDLSKATPSSGVSHSALPESEETTHFSVVDQYGWAVSVTTTLNASYGSGFVAAGTGILLNNEMDDFSIKPGFPNMYGLVGAEANAIQPQKRMLSSMTPTIVTRNDTLMWILGSPGGGAIITSVAQVLMNMIDFDMSLTDAVNAPRFHHQWMPDVIFVENYAFPPDLALPWIGIEIIILPCRICGVNLRHRRINRFYMKVVHELTQRCPWYTNFTNITLTEIYFRYYL
jgi:gamma-glutamyltranspeptidase/glutathione hydrolase